MHRLKTAAAVLAVSTVMLAGCAETQGDVGNRNIKPNSVLKDGNGNLVIDRRFANDQLNEQNRVYGKRLNSNNLIGSHQNYRMEVSQDIAERIREAEGMGEVFVVLTDRNAYVAVNKRIDAGDRIERRNVTEGRDVQDAGGGGKPLRSSRTQSRSGLGDGTSGSAAGEDRAGQTSAGGTLEERVARHVKQMAPRIERVYVSEEPEFVSRMHEYVATARGGKPIQPFIAEFNAMVERLFPAKSGIRISHPSPSIYD